MNPQPSVALVGGPDVDARLPLMGELRAHYAVRALGSDPALAPKFTAAGFDYCSYPLSRRLSPFGDVRTIVRLGATFRRLRPDIVHAFDTKPGVFGCIAARRAAVPIVVTTVTGLGSLYASDDFKTRMLRRVYETLQRAASRRADVTIFQNHDDLRQLAAASVVTAEKSTVILGSGVDTDAFSAERVGDTARKSVRAELGIPTTATVVTMIARVTRTKGVPEFVAAAKAVAAADEGVRFLLIGPEDRDSLDRLNAEELADLRRCVIWPGRRNDIANVLAASDVFVLPTAYREGVPRVLLEAASMGLPLVATDSPGCNEIVVDRSNGRLMPVGDIAALTAAVRDLVGNPELRRRYGAASRRRVVTSFDLRVIAGQIHDVYRGLLEQRDQRLKTPAAARGRR